MRALDKKLYRDLWKIKGQGLAISLVIAAGLTMFVMYLSTFDSLRLTQATYYDRFHFAEVFASLKRAPNRLIERIAEIPGVARAETRVVAAVNLDVAGLDEPAVGRLISIPERQRPMLNGVFLRRGRYIEPDRPDEVLVTEAFALAHGLEPGDSVTAIINGRRRELEIVGIALSPEFVYNIRPGEFFPDDARFGVFWMERRALATAFDMEGGFNDVALELMPGASEPEVIARLDRLLEPYGGLGAIPRQLQTSHWYLESELLGLQTAGMIVPVIFLSVAAFLLNVVLIRIIAVQREQIAALKALGYSNRDLAVHYLKWSLVITLVGAALGSVGGVWLGSGLTNMYNAYFRFPVLQYRLAPGILVGALVFSLVAAVLGAVASVRRAVRLPPAEAMRPQPPATYRQSWLERVGLQRWLSQPARMIVRNIHRRPARILASVTGMAFALAMLIVGTFFLDSLDELVFVQFDVAQRQDITVTFVEPASARSLHEIQRVPGVLYTEPLRTVPARLRVGHRSRQVGIMGLPARSELNRVIDASLRPVELPAYGLVLSSKLAEILGAQRGDVVLIEVLEGARPVREAVVTELIEEYLGANAYMEVEALHRLMREGGSLSGTFLQVDSARLPELYRRLKAIPAVAGVNLKLAALQSFEETLAETMGVFIFFNILFAGIIAFGVVYNAARVSLSERSHELASLRVLGFTRAEIAFILLGELAVVTLASLPAGILLGYGLAWLTTLAYNTELYRLPLVVYTRTYTLAIVTVLIAAIVSGYTVRKKLGRLDLIAVLKTRE